VSGLCPPLCFEDENAVIAFASGRWKKLAKGRRHTSWKRPNLHKPGFIWNEALADQRVFAPDLEEARCAYTLGNIRGEIEPKDDATLLGQGAGSLLIRRLPPPGRRRLGGIGKAAALAPLDPTEKPHDLADAPALAPLDPIEEPHNIADAPDSADVADGADVAYEE
jgi:hypothetical protein